MKEIKAYVHRDRVADVLQAVEATQAWAARRLAAGPHNLTVYAVLGTRASTDRAEQRYSVDLGHEVVAAYKLELHCDDGDVAELVAAIRAAGRTGQMHAGWIYVVDIVSAGAIA